MSESVYLCVVGCVCMPMHVWVRVCVCVHVCEFEAEGFTHVVSRERGKSELRQNLP